MQKILPKFSRNNHIPVSVGTRHGGKWRKIDSREHFFSLCSVRRFAHYRKPAKPPGESLMILLSCRWMCAVRQFWMPKVNRLHQHTLASHAKRKHNAVTQCNTIYLPPTIRKGGSRCGCWVTISRCIPNRSRSGSNMYKWEAFE